MTVELEDAVGICGGIAEGESRRGVEPGIIDAKDDAAVENVSRSGIGVHSGNREISRAGFIQAAAAGDVAGDGGISRAAEGESAGCRDVSSGKREGLAYRGGVDLTAACTDGEAAAEGGGGAGVGESAGVCGIAEDDGSGGAAECVG